MQVFEEDKTQFPIRLEKKLVFTSLKKYVTSYTMLQILSQVNILKKCQLKGETLLPYTNLFRRSMGLPCAHILEWRVLENQGLLLNYLASYWLLYRAQPSRNTEINDPVWKDWPENIQQKPDLHYVDPETTLILGPVVDYTPLEANSSSTINTPWFISLYQPDTDCTGS